MTTDHLDDRRQDSAAGSEPSGGTSEEQVTTDELEAQAADDFFHDRPAATSARVFDAGANSGD